ncbi:multiple sugar transport system permease protein [Paramixta manurensis]|uniref:Multiple sugar transport system permease protein n=1 Tax=Paramixta manurensis TaxID=2740817 RepID=A0A6M8U6J9_9GAMM|nr:multiple sugar transport system permease protein [Erwiniaceae bacterium PD-1]
MKAKLTQQVFTLPLLMILLLVSFYTLGYAIYLAIYDIDLMSPPPFNFIGLANFIDVLQQPRLWSSLWHTLVYVAGSTVTELVLGSAIALFISHDFFGRKLVRALLLLPMIVTPIVGGLIWRIFYDPNAGLFNWLAGLVGIAPIDWLGNPNTAMASLILADIWQWTPFIILLVSAGLDALPNEPLEAAELDGARGWRLLAFIKLPMMKPIILMALFLRMIDAFKSFDLIYVMTRGGPALATETTNMFAYLTGFQDFRISEAVVIAIINTLLVIVVLSVASKRIMKDD